MSLLQLVTFLFVKGLKSVRYQKIWLAAVAQLERSPHHAKVKGLTPAADSACRENDNERYKKIT
jgi:hypothetical protein